MTGTPEPRTPADMAAEGFPAERAARQRRRARAARAGAAVVALGLGAAFLVHRADHPAHHPPAAPSLSYCENPAAVAQYGGTCPAPVDGTQTWPPGTPTGSTIVYQAACDTWTQLRAEEGDPAATDLLVSTFVSQASAWSAYKISSDAVDARRSWTASPTHTIDPAIQSALDADCRR